VPKNVTARAHEKLLRKSEFKIYNICIASKLAEIKMNQPKAETSVKQAVRK